jgi:FG-GAP-like repeat
VTKSRRLKLFYRAVRWTVVFALWGVFSPVALAQNPVPFINLPLVPDATAPGGPPFTLTVNGTGFVSGSVVNWNGSALVTQFINASQLKATVPAADIAVASTAEVTVVNPAPRGGTSNVALFAVTTATSSVGFGPASSASSGPGAGLSVVGGDFNGDSRTDLAAPSGDGVSVFLANADGTFQAPVHYGVSVGSLQFDARVATADINGDGKLDLIVPSSDTVAVLLGNGDGTFQPHIDSPGVGVRSIATGDLNGDGKLDLAVTITNFSYSSSTVSIMLGNGDGTFQAPADAKTVTERGRQAGPGGHQPE